MRSMPQNKYQVNLFPDDPSFKITKNNKCTQLQYKYALITHYRIWLQILCKSH